MGVPVVNILSAVPGWGRYFVFLLVLSGDVVLSALISTQGVDNQGVFGGILTFVFQNIFQVKGFVITPLNLLIIAVVAPLVFYMFRNPP